MQGIPSGIGKTFTLKDLLKEQTRDLWDAEKEYAKQLPRMIELATDGGLQEILLQCKEVTEHNNRELTSACEILGVDPGGQPCEAMKGLIREAKEHEQKWEFNAVHDAALISNCQRIAHYELAGFGTAREFAKCLGEEDLTKIFGGLLDNAARIDKALTEIAVGGWFSTGINQTARDA